MFSLMFEDICGVQCLLPTKVQTIPTERCQTVYPDFSPLYDCCNDFLWKSKVAGHFDLSKFHKSMEPAFQRLGFREQGTSSNPSILVSYIGRAGDNILTTPMLRELRRNQPQAHITFVTASAVYPLMELCPYVDEVLSIPYLSSRQDDSFVLQTIISFAREHLWKHHYDICILPQWPSDNRPSRLFSYISGSRERWGYSDTAQKLYAPLNILPTNELYLLNHAICNPPEIIHEADRYLYMLEAMGMSVAERHTELWLSPQDRERADSFLMPLTRSDVDILIALSTGAGDNSRQYPVEKWLIAMREIIALGGRFIIIGGPSEMEDGKFLEERLPKDTVLNLTGQTTLRESVAIIEASDLFMGNDSGMMHAAAACQRPIIAVYREALDKEPIATGLLSEFRRFEPYMANYIALRPEHALDDCKAAFCYGGCQSINAHCICQVEPTEVVEAFRMITT